MKHPDLKIYMAVLSHGRPDSVKEVEGYLGCEATWYVGEGESSSYRRHGAERVVAAGNLPDSRNTALEDAWKYGFTCVQCSDDCRRFSIATERMVNLTALTTAILIKSAMEAVGGVYLGGGNSTSNPYMAIGLRTGSKLPPQPSAQLISYNRLVLGDFSVVRPCGIFFEDDILVKEDYAYTLKHLVAFGRVVRCNYILQDFRHRANLGGANLWRNEGAEQDACKKILERWPGVIRPAKPKSGSSFPELMITWKSELRDHLLPARFARI